MKKSPVLHFFCRHQWLLKASAWHQHVCFASEVGCKSLWSDGGVRHTHPMTQVVLEGVPPPQKKWKRKCYAFKAFMCHYVTYKNSKLEQIQCWIENTAFHWGLSIFCCCNFRHRQKVQTKKADLCSERCWEQLNFLAAHYTLRKPTMSSSDLSWT